MENIISYVGFYAGFCTTIAFIPQAIKAWKSKSTKDISLLMFLIFTTGVIFWLIYGVLLSELPLVIANAVTLVFAISILIAKIKYD